LLYVNHLAETGVALYTAACGMDLEGVIAKLATAPYGTEPPSWIKIKNPAYSQAIGRRERFEKMNARRATGARA
jgi:ATP-dependent DNA ligase